MAIGTIDNTYERPSLVSLVLILLRVHKQGLGFLKLSEIGFHPWSISEHSVELLPVIRSTGSGGGVGYVPSL